MKHRIVRKAVSHVVAFTLASAGGTGGTLILGGGMISIVAGSDDQ